MRNKSDQVPALLSLTVRKGHGLQGKVPIDIQSSPGIGPSTPCLGDNVEDSKGD